MIEGIVVANELEGPRADLVRSALWLAMDGDAADSPGAVSPVGDGAATGRGVRAAVDAPARPEGTDSAARPGQPAAKSAPVPERAAA